MDKEKVEAENDNVECTVPAGVLYSMCCHCVPDKEEDSVDSARWACSGTVCRRRRLRKKRAYRRKVMAEIMRHLAASFTKLIRFLCQK